MKRTKNIHDKRKEVIITSLQNPHQAIRQLTKGSLFKFIVYFWSCYSQDPFVPNWHIEKICKHLEKVAHAVGKRQKKLYDPIINVPPGSTKTAMVSIFFPIWVWVNYPWVRFITTSHSASLSLESAEYSRDIIRNDKFKAVFPDLDIKQDKDTKGNFRVVTKEQVYPGRAPRITHGGGRVSTSLDGRITGFHAHIIIVDDLIDPKRAFSDVEVQNSNNYLDQTLSTRKTSKESSVTILIMQRLSENDPTDHLLKKKNRKTLHICLPGQIRDYYEQLHPKKYAKYYSKDGLLDPVRMDWDVLADMETDLGQYGYSSQVGQKITPPEGGMFKTDHFRIIPVMVAEVNVLETVRYWDKAGTDEKELKKGQDACYTAGVKMCKLKNGKWIILDRVKGRWSANEREDIIRETAEADGVQCAVWIEQEPGSGGKESAEATIRNLAGYSCYAEHPTGNKIYRADPYSVQVNNGNVLLLKGDWNQDFINEHSNFPFGKFKDQVDAAAGAFNKLTSKKLAQVLRKG